MSTAAQVKADVTSKIRIPQIAASGKVVDAILKTVTTTFTSDNKTIWSNVQSANKTIQGNVKSTVTVLSVTKWDALIAELILLNTAILSVQGQYDLFAIALTAQLSLTLTAQTAANTKFGDDVLVRVFVCNQLNVSSLTTPNTSNLMISDCIHSD